MIYGTNFNGTPIPDTPAWNRLFTKEKKLYRCDVCSRDRIGTQSFGKSAMECAGCKRVTSHSAVRGIRARLVGVGQSEEERNAMLMQISNGSRVIHIQSKQTAAGVWYGFYVS